VAIILPRTARAGDRKEPSALERYIDEATRTHAAAGVASPGSLWSQGSGFSNLASDLRASQVNDTVTVLVSERASAVSTGTTKSARSSSADASVTSLAGPIPAGRPLSNLAALSSNTKLDGQGTTTRATELTTTVTARVVHVLPNGNLVLEAAKNIQVNSERQLVTVRGIVRPSDLGPENVVRSDRLAMLEVQINGKGVVGDAIRRPFFLYRVLLGLLPF
jgi:flagellar L-ring protein precursor FlgH